jgi:hypothetical protein
MFAKSQVYLALGLAFVAFPIKAQVPADVRERLGSNGITKAGQWIYGSASGTQRGTREGTEDLLATKAMRLIAHSLCNFEPNPNTKLEVAVSGFTMVSSEARGQDLVVTMRAPLQNPSCRVVSLPSRKVAGSTIAPENNITDTTFPYKDEQATVERATVLVEPSYSRSKDITIRVFGGEY